MRSLYCAALMFLILTGAAFCQSTLTGTPPFNSFAGGPDIVNLGNLNVHWDFPIIQKPGRGLPFLYLLTYDNSVWYPSGGYWTHTSNYGWGANAANIGGQVLANTTFNTCFDRWLWQDDYYTTFNFYAYIDAAGTYHPFTATTDSMAYDAPSCIAQG